MYFLELIKEYFEYILNGVKLANSKYDTKKTSTHIICFKNNELINITKLTCQLELSNFFSCRSQKI